MRKSTFHGCKLVQCRRFGQKLVCRPMQAMSSFGFRWFDQACGKALRKTTEARTRAIMRIKCAAALHRREKYKAGQTIGHLRTNKNLNWFLP